MTNLFVTSNCNQKCDFCFAPILNKSDNSELDRTLSINSFIRYLDYLDRSNINQVRLLGGEPTIHPKFTHFIDMALARNKNILVFTNGNIPKKILNYLTGLSQSQCTVLVNLTPQNKLMSGVSYRKIQNITALKHKAYLGYTISSPKMGQLDYLLDVIEATDCSRIIRVGLAHPSTSGGFYLHPKQYRQASLVILDFVRKGAIQKVKLQFDCGFVRCMFSDQEFSELREYGCEPAWNCYPTIDVDNLENAIHCFPLSAERTIPNAFDVTHDDLVLAFNDQFKTLRILGVYPECSNCAVRISAKCSGGCLALTKKRKHTANLIYDLPPAQLGFL